MSTPPAKRVAILQSSYVPWKGYFDLINSVDEFILYDDRQFTRRDWRSRNRIKTPQGVIWLTVPVKVRGRYTQRIDETEIADPAWADRHWRTIAHGYASAPHFPDCKAPLEEAYRDSSAAMLLSSINRRLLETLCEILGIRTPITRSSDYDASGAKTERLVQICRAAGATTYLTGPAAQAYLDEALFADAGIGVEYMDYSGYPEYAQLYPPFEHAVSVIDLLVHTGADAPKYMKSFAGRSEAVHAA